MRIALVILLFGLLLPITIPSAQAQEADWTEFQQLMAQGRTEEAVALVRARLDEHPDDGLAWYLMASAHHAAGEYEEAAEANAKAAELDATVRESALYNQACALSLLGELKKADKALDKALEAGFTDFDLLAGDPDLQVLRDAGRVELPPRAEYRPFVGQNKVRFGYQVLLPEGWSEDRSYPVVVAFGPGDSGIHSCDWALAHLWGEAEQRGEAIVVVPHAPDDGWMNRPAHQALNDLLANLIVDFHPPEAKLHMVGYRDGSRLAATFTTMSDQFFQSLTLFGGDGFAAWDDVSMKDFPAIPVHFVYGNLDEVSKTAALRNRDRFREYGRKVQLTALPGEGPLMTGLWDGKLLEQVAATIAMVDAAAR